MPSQISNVLMILFGADRSVTIIIIKHFFVHIVRPVVSVSFGKRRIQAVFDLNSEVSPCWREISSLSVSKMSR